MSTTTSVARNLVISSCAALLLFPSLAPAQHHDHAAIGSVEFDVSCNDAARATFHVGLALLHHMMYEQAEEQFRGAADADPACAMAYWGVAMTQLHPLWDPPTEQEIAKARAAIDRARALGAPTARERGYVDAIAAYFQETPDRDHRARLAAWSAAQEKLHEAHPNDIDAGAFYALSRLATAPPDDRSFSNQAEAGALLETLLAKAPEHPGLFHYTIHAYDNPVLARRGVDVANGYDQLAPDVPHALHMPSHIFVRLGMWPEVASWNLRSAESALRQPVGNATSMHHIHALDYLVYAKLQQGEDAEARRVLDEIEAVDNYQATFAAAYGIAAAQVRLPLERAQWPQAAALPLRTHSEFPWDRYPWAEAILYFARGLGAARSGDTAGGGAAIEALDDIHERTLAAGERYWAVHVDAQRKAVAAWIAQAEGRGEEALELMRAAADLEDSVDKHPVTPGAVLPARELLGEMLLLHDRPADALTAYQASLAISPGRANALLGAGRAAELSGKAELARSYYRQAVSILSGEGDRPWLADAEKLLAPGGP